MTRLTFVKYNDDGIPYCPKCKSIMVFKKIKEFPEHTFLKCHKTSCGLIVGEK